MKEQRTAHRKLFRYQLGPGLVDDIRDATNGNYALGARIRVRPNPGLVSRIPPFSRPSKTGGPSCLRSTGYRAKALNQPFTGMAITFRSLF